MQQQQQQQKQLQPKDIAGKTIAPSKESTLSSTDLSRLSGEKTADIGLIIIGIIAAMAITAILRFICYMFGANNNRTFNCEMVNCETDNCEADNCETVNIQTDNCPTDNGQTEKSDN